MLDSFRTFFSVISNCTTVKLNLCDYCVEDFFLLLLLSVPLYTDDNSVFTLGAVEH